LQYTRLLSRKVLLAAVLAALGASVAGCGSGSSHNASGGSTTLVTADRWRPPNVPLTPSTGGYCTAVVSIYKHVADLPRAATQKVRTEIVGDYLGEVPTMIATAPQPVASASKVYFNAVAEILADLQKAGLDPKKLTDPNLGRVLLDPAIKSAGDRVITFVSDNCDYKIGG
jgi:hypothetical protein